MITTSKAKLICLAACLIWAMPLAAEQTPRAEIRTASRIGTTSPMANYRATHHSQPNAPVRDFPLRKPGSRPGSGSGGGLTWTDPLLQTSPVNSDLRTIINSGIDGLASVGYVPPDTNISVGNDQIVETVNVTYAVYDKAGHVLQPATAMHTIFAAAGASSMCSTVDGGDPIVLFDKVDQRWIISQLAYNTRLTDNHFCLAISTSSDATGKYSAYDVSFGKDFPDYPKLGVWATGSWTSPGSVSGIYFSTNIFNGGNTFAGAQMCGFPLSDVAHPPASFQWVCSPTMSNLSSVLPADLEGSPGVTGTTSPAPSGAGEYFLGFTGASALQLVQFTPDFAGQSVSIAGPTDIGVDVFREACGGGACVPQYGPSARLDSLGDRLMYRLSYRNYNGAQSMVVSHSVQNSSSSSQTGVRWYQLTGTGASWTIAQKGTFGPNDGLYRWMGSIAQDKQGNLGLGYSVSSASVFPYLAVTGKTPGDSGMELETQFNIGKGAQKSVNRWGDYSSMSVDPSDDCTMWYANEYLKKTGSYTNWGTFIVGFRFNSCN
ncbi:MAG: hypothetical protein EPN47_16685 [Acidobacteria bacterium]|nr:MAG: hypothetical protein EPN47_16685 [Acidobacteriota bacterium]